MFTSMGNLELVLVVPLLIVLGIAKSRSDLKDRLGSKVHAAHRVSRH